MEAAESSEITKFYNRKVFTHRREGLKSDTDFFRTKMLQNWRILRNIIIIIIIIITTRGI
jgi:hypothetical protein